MPSYRDFLDYAEGFYYTAKQGNKPGQNHIIESSVIASILLSWIAVESFMNDMMADFTALPSDMFSLPERALLTERSLELLDHGPQIGHFVISDKPDYIPLEHKIMFLVAKFGTGTKLDKGGYLWQNFEAMKEKRNQITHPRKSSDMSLTLDDAEDALEVAKAVIRMVSEKVWKKEIDL